MHHIRNKDLLKKTKKTKCNEDAHVYPYNVNGARVNGMVHTPKENIKDCYNI